MLELPLVIGTVPYHGFGGGGASLAGPFSMDVSWLALTLPEQPEGRVLGGAFRVPGDTDGTSEQGLSDRSAQMSLNTAPTAILTAPVSQRRKTLFLEGTWAG